MDLHSSGPARLPFFSNLSEYIFWGGEQASWWGPMWIAVIVGLIFAKALTFILVPVLYSVIERARRKLNMVMFGTTEPGIIKDQSELNGESKPQTALEPTPG